MSGPQAYYVFDEKAVKTAFGVGSYQYKAFEISLQEANKIADNMLAYAATMNELDKVETNFNVLKNKYESMGYQIEDMRSLGNAIRNEGDKLMKAGGKYISELKADHKASDYKSKKQLNDGVNYDLPNFQAATTPKKAKQSQ